MAQQDDGIALAGHTGLLVKDGRCLSLPARDCRNTQPEAHHVPGYVISVTYNGWLNH